MKKCPHDILLSLVRNRGSVFRLNSERALAELGQIVKTILIADDSTFLRLILRDVFSKNYRILEAEDGENAVKLFREERPDVVLLDVVMPERDGMGALREIKKLDPQAKVIMVTAVGQESIIHECRKLGAIDYITKPFDEQAVLKTVEKYL